MKFSVIQLRRRGIRLARDEIAALTPTVGELLINDWVGLNAEKRPLKQANIYQRMSTQDRGILVPLFEPQLIRMNKKWFVLSGWQIEGAAGVYPHYRQEWLVRMAEEGDDVRLHAAGASVEAP